MKDPRIIRQAIEQAEHELAEIEGRLQEMKPLMQRHDALETFLLHAKALLPSDEDSSTSAGKLAEDAPQTHDDGDPKGHAIWEGASHILAQARRPLRVAEIVKGMIERGRKLSDKWASEVVRAAMGRRPDVFERVGPGLYALKSWPPNLKTPKK